jgi:hypothetical protein
VTEHDFSICGHSVCRPSEEPICWHCLELEVHVPLAQAKFEPHDMPFGLKISAGQADELPVHVSAVSQTPSFAARQTRELEAKPHVSVQHGLFVGSHTAPVLNLHSLVQHWLLPLGPGSHSSPESGSTIPLPHCLSEMSLGVFNARGEIRQLLFVKPPPPSSGPSIREPMKF